MSFYPPYVYPTAYAVAHQVCQLEYKSPFLSSAAAGSPGFSGWREPPTPGGFPELRQASPDFDFNDWYPTVYQLQQQNGIEMASSRVTPIGWGERVSGWPFQQDESMASVRHVKSRQPSDRKLFDPRYKTALCENPEFVRTGRCPFGAKCNFAHGERELRRKVCDDKYKTLRCIYVSKEQCIYKKKCTFAHVDDEPGIWVKARRSSGGMAKRVPETKLEEEVPRLNVPCVTDFFGPDPNSGPANGIGDNSFTESCVTVLNAWDRDLSTGEKNIKEHFWSLLDELEKAHRDLSANHVRNVICI